MKRIIYFLLFLPLFSAAQKIRVNEIDKFIKQKRIETFPLTLLSATNIKLAVTLSSVGPNLYLQLSGSGMGANRIEAHDKVIFLFDNDSTVTVQSKGYQNFEIGITTNSYRHSYILTIPDLIKLSRHNVQALRKYHSDAYDDIYISKESSALFKKLTDLFIAELAKENLIPTAKPVMLKDVVRYIGDSVTISATVADSRYLYESSEPSTLLDFGATQPSQSVTAVIAAPFNHLFGDYPAGFYKGKKVRVSGRVVSVNNKPYIYLERKEQLEILEEQPAAATAVGSQPATGTTPAGSEKTLSRAPGFPGGYEVWMDFLKRNLNPPVELKEGESKTVVVKFLVAADGTVSNMQVIQSGGAAFDKEVLRVLARMPKWKAALENNRPTTATVTQPVTFHGVAPAGTGQKIM